MTLHIRQYDPRDVDAVVALDAWAMREAGTDPADIPGHEDIDRIGSAYLDAGGEFLVGVLDLGATDAPAFGMAEKDDRATLEEDDRATLETFETFDGLVVAMGGYLPSESGYEDERTVSGAAELHRMRVAPPVQGRGYGARLLRELEDRVAAAGFERVLATTAQRQRGAVNLYPGCGYERVGTSAYGEYQLIHFEKVLEPCD